MLTRVQENGRPVAEVPITVFAEGERRLVATTGESGLAVVEFGRVPIRSGARVATYIVRCPGTREVMFVRADAALPVLAAGCERTSLGPVSWFRSDRMEIEIGSEPSLTARTAEAVLEARSGFRAQIGPQVAFVMGDELSNIGFGFGGELLLGYDLVSGLGIGVGLGLLNHDLDGLDERLWRWVVTVEPRYTINRPQWTARPYVAGRISWQSLNAEDGSGLATESGWGFGAGAGVVFPFVFGTSLDASTHLAFVSVDAQGFGRSGSIWTSGFAVRF